MRCFDRKMYYMIEMFHKEHDAKRVAFRNVFVEYRREYVTLCDEHIMNCNLKWIYLDGNILRGRSRNCSWLGFLWVWRWNEYLRTFNVQWYIELAFVATSTISCIRICAVKNEIVPASAKMYLDIQNLETFVYEFESFYTAFNLMES